MYDPASQRWSEWKLPGARPQAYAVFVDDRDKVWLTDFGGNALVRFDPETEKFTRSRWRTPTATSASSSAVRRGLGCRVRARPAGRRANGLADVPREPGEHALVRSLGRIAVVPRAGVVEEGMVGAGESDELVRQPGRA